jgi:hypothetical protein
MSFVPAWIDYDQTERDRVNRILELFLEKESRDELGLGSVRDSFADLLFPGTSTIQTRLRYMLFVPWIYRSLEEKKVSSEVFASKADSLERELVQPLLESEDNAGVYGRVAGQNLKRLPSEVYWSGLGAWGIRLIDCSRDEYHRRVDRIYNCRQKLRQAERSSRELGDDADFDWKRETQTWHPKLPEIPDDFPEKADLRLTREEAEFIRDRIQLSCHRSLLAFLARKPTEHDEEFP